MTKPLETVDVAELREAYALAGEGADFDGVAEARGEAFDRWLISRDTHVAQQVLLSAAGLVTLHNTAIGTFLTDLAAAFAPKGT